MYREQLNSGRGKGPFRKPDGPETRIRDAVAASRKKTAYSPEPVNERNQSNSVSDKRGGRKLKEVSCKQYSDNPSNQSSVKNKTASEQGKKIGQFSQSVPFNGTKGNEEKEQFCPEYSSHKRKGFHDNEIIEIQMKAFHNPVADQIGNQQSDDYHETV